MKIYLVDIIETVHHFYTLKAETKGEAMTKANELFTDKGDDGVAISEDDVEINQCIDLNNPKETSQVL